MKIFLALLILLNSFMAVAGSVNSCKEFAQQLKSNRGPASAPNCQTAGQLMSSELSGKDFTRICRNIVDQDPGCKKLKPEKKMSCNAKRENQILSSADLLAKAGQCAKGFLWDSMVDLGKFVLDIIKLLVKSSVNSVVGMARFLTDSDFRERTIAASGNALSSGGRMAAAFLNSAALYWAREYPRNVAKHPFNPLAAIGETLLAPLMKFVTESVQAIASYYIPQYQCMNGTAKLYTICRVLGDFIMPPAFMFTFLKQGINGLRAMKAGAEAARIARVERRFAEANEMREVASVARKVETPRPSRIAADHAPGAPAAARGKHVVHPAPAPAHASAVPHPARPALPAPLAKPIERHTPDELIEIARSEKVDPEVSAVAAANKAELERIQAANATPAAAVVVESADEVAEKLMNVKEYKAALEGLAGSEKAEAAHAIEQLSKSGAAPGIVVNLVEKYSPMFKADVARTPAGAEDLWSKLGRFVKREKAAGKSDQAIEKQIDDAFKCN